MIGNWKEEEKKEPLEIKINFDRKRDWPRPAKSCDVKKITQYLKSMCSNLFSLIFFSSNYCIPFLCYYIIKIVHKVKSHPHFDYNLQQKKSEWHFFSSNILHSNNFFISFFALFWCVPKHFFSWLEFFMQPITYKFNAFIIQSTLWIKFLECKTTTIYKIIRHSL